jgi:hypothetical protein
MWPFRRARRASPQPAPAAPVYRAGPGAWRHLPTMPTVQASRPAMGTFDVQFAQRLATRANPAFLGQLSHYVIADAPSGSVRAAAVPTDRQFAPRPRLDPPTMTYEVPVDADLTAGGSAPADATDAGPAPSAPHQPPAAPTVVPTVSRRLLQASPVELPRYAVSPVPAPANDAPAPPAPANDAPAPPATPVEVDDGAASEAPDAELGDAPAATPRDEVPLLPGHVELPTVTADWAAEPTTNDTSSGRESATPTGRSSDVPVTVARSALPGAGPRPPAPGTPPTGTPRSSPARGDQAAAPASASTPGTAVPRPRIGPPLDTPLQRRTATPRTAAPGTPGSPSTARVPPSAPEPPTVGTLGTAPGAAPGSPAHASARSPATQPAIPAPVQRDATGPAPAHPAPLPGRRAHGDPPAPIGAPLTPTDSPLTPIGADADAPTRPIVGERAPVVQLSPASGDESATHADGSPPPTGTGAAPPAPDGRPGPVTLPVVATVARTVPTPAGPTAALLGARPAPRVLTVERSAPLADGEPKIRPSTPGPGAPAGGQSAGPVAAPPSPRSPAGAGSPSSSLGTVAQRIPLRPGAPTGPVAAPATGAPAAGAWSTMTFSARAPEPMSLALPDTPAAEDPPTAARLAAAGLSPFLQREPDTVAQEPIAATTAEGAPSPSTTTTPATAAPEPHQRSDAEIQELLSALYPQLRRRLGRDLLLDRERHGYRTDIRF